MKLNLFFIIGVFLMLLVSASAAPIPYNFSYIVTDGSEGHLLADNQTFIFVEFFATWCESCRFEMSTLLTLNSVLPDTIIMKQISISPDTDGLEKIIKYKEEFGATWEFGVDSDDFLAGLFDVSTLPSAILFDPHGYRLKMWVGITELSKFINDLNDEMPNANIPTVNGSNDKVSFAVDRLLSNPLFVFTAIIIFLSPFVLVLFSKVKKKNLAIIYQ